MRRPGIFTGGPPEFTSNIQGCNPQLADCQGTPAGITELIAADVEQLRSDVTLSVGDNGVHDWMLAHKTPLVFDGTCPAQQTGRCALTGRFCLDAEINLSPPESQDARSGLLGSPSEREQPISSRSSDNLTRELAAIGIPNPFASLRLTQRENYQLFGREYPEWMKVSDRVTTPHGQELYRHCAAGDDDTSLAFDPTGELSHRAAPPDGFVYAVVQSPTGSRFWRLLEAAVGLTVQGDNFIVDEGFVATYGAPAGSEAIPEAGQELLEDEH